MPLQRRSRNRGYDWSVTPDGRLLNGERTLSLTRHGDGPRMKADDVSPDRRLRLAPVDPREAGVRCRLLQ